MARISKKTKDRGLYRNFAAAVAIAMMTVFLVVQQSAAGPITGGMGNPPYSKLSVYQGVISIVPGGSNDHVMEIGYAGRDIASTGSIYLRPGSVTTSGGAVGGGDVIIAPQDTAAEGGELVLQGAGTHTPWWLDVILDRFRIYDNAGIERFVVANDGNVYVPSVNGKLCFGNAGDTSNCINSGTGTLPTLDYVLSQGNSTIRSAALGETLTPLSKLVVNNGTSSTGSATDSLSTFANTVGSAVYAQQNNGAGFAGYFSGRVNVGSLEFTGNPRRKTDLAVQVYPVGSDTPLGKYLYSSGTGAAVKYCYQRNNLLAPTQCIAAFNNTATGSCPATYEVHPRDVEGISYFATLNCTGTEYIDKSDWLSSGTLPYGSGSTCINIPAGGSGIVTIGSYRSRVGNGSCLTYTSGSRTVYTVVNSFTGEDSYVLAHELR